MRLSIIALRPSCHLCAKPLEGHNTIIMCHACMQHGRTYRLRQGAPASQRRLNMTLQTCRVSCSGRDWILPELNFAWKILTWPSMLAQTEKRITHFAKARRRQLMRNDKATSLLFVIPWCSYNTSRLHEAHRYIRRLEEVQLPSQLSPQNPRALVRC